MATAYDNPEQNKPDGTPPEPLEPVEGVTPVEPVQPAENAAPPETVEPGVVAIEPVTVETAPPAETRAGRLMRSALRWLLIGLGLALVGFLLAFFLLYQPLQQQLSASRADLEAANQQLTDTQTSLDTAAADLKKVQDRYNRAQLELDSTTARLGLAKVLQSVALARYSLAANDTPAAVAAMEDARTELDEILPVLEERVPNVADSIDLRMGVIAAELERDKATALSDLEILTDLLTPLDVELAKEQ